MSLSELITAKTAGETPTRSVKYGYSGTNQLLLASEVSSDQPSFKDLILAAETIESTVENTLHDQNQASEDARTQIEGDKNVVNLAHFTNEPFVDDAKSEKEQENTEHNGAGSEPNDTTQVAIQGHVQPIVPLEVSLKVTSETTGFVRLGNQEKTAIPTQNKEQGFTQIHGQNQAQSQAQSQAQTIEHKQSGLQYASIYTSPSEPSLVKQYSLPNLNVMGGTGSLGPSSDINSVISHIASPLETNEAKVIQHKVVLPVSATQENPGLTKQHGLSLIHEKSNVAPFSYLQHGLSQITKFPQTVQGTLGKVTLSNIEGAKVTELSSTIKLPASTQGYSPSVHTNQESIQSNLPSHPTIQGSENEPAEKQTQLGQQVITNEKNSPLSEGSKSLGASHLSRNHSVQKEGMSDWVMKVTKPLEADSMLSPKGASIEKGAELLKSEITQMGSAINFNVVPEMMVVQNGQKDEWTGDQSLEEWLSNGVQTNGKPPEVEVAVAQRRSASPIFLQQMRKIVEQKDMNQGIWTKHSFALEDGEHVQISTRKMDGQVQIKVLASQNELQRALFQQSGQLRDLLQKDYNVEVEFEFNGQQSFAEQGTSDYGEQSANGQSRSFEGAQSGEREVAEQVQSTPKKGFNNNEWRG